MDFVFLSAILNIILLYIFISYDIACQWSVNLLRRAKLFPPVLGSILDRVQLTFGIPKFHLPAHGSKCRSKFSLNFVDNWARVDGEGIERVWSFLNGFAPASREMARGARHDFLDYQVGSMNFRKVVELGKIVKRTGYLDLTNLFFITKGSNLQERLEDAGEGIELHKKAFEDLRSACNVVDPGITDKWDEIIASWQKNRTIKPDPYQEDETRKLDHIQTICYS